MTDPPNFPTHSTKLACLSPGSFTVLSIQPPPNISSLHSFSAFPSPGRHACMGATSPPAVAGRAAVPLLLYEARTGYYLLQPQAGCLTVYVPSRLYSTITFQNSSPKPKLLVCLSETENFGTCSCWWPEAMPGEYNTDRALALTVIYCALKT